MPPRSQRDALEAVGFPLFGLAGDGFHRSVGGHGWSGDERRLGLRHLRGSTRVDVETIAHRTFDDDSFRPHAGVMQWASARNPFPATLTVELRVGPVDVRVDGDPVRMWSLGDDEVWFVAGRVGDRHVEVTASGLPLGELALVRLHSIDGYELLDERTT